MQAMQAKTRDLWAGALAGAVVVGILTAILESVGMTAPYSNGAGAFVGGAVAAYVMYGKQSKAAGAGALSGLIGTPLYVGVEEILYAFGLFPVPSGPTPSRAVLEAAVFIIFALDLLAGVFGATVVAAVHHPRVEPVPLQQQSITTPMTQNRYCIQCGALLPPGAVVCPSCNARQP